MSEAQRRVEKTTHLVHSSALLSEAKRASCSRSETREAKLGKRQSSGLSEAPFEAVNNCFV
ncbi:hypothetical protein [Methanosarcina barkeri]|uniref:hypothetical protein n=1 Tax=Methanosarcina barkeri TaxID=2208 RepID=UPI0012D43893|nr:hypothetical protein [Methanosarcina barkeri]